MDRILFAAFVFSSFLLNACSKNKRPSIEISSPKNEQTFNANTAVEINAKIWDSDAVTSEFLFVIKFSTSNDDTIINFKDYKFYPGPYCFKDTFSTEGNSRYKIVIGGYGHGNRVADSIFVSCN